MPEFDDIRPYNDEEVRPTLDRLLHDNEFLDTIARLKLSSAGRYFAAVTRPLIRNRLAKEFTGINTVHDVQMYIRDYLESILERTVTRLSVSGIDKLERGRAHLFISNHRDIAMDPAFVNWVLHEAGFTTLRIAIGDNLLTKPFASDLMRINKSFIVNRSARAPREKLKAAKHLSKYIHHSVMHDNENVWIAQREGRAKNGIDKTNQAIISMLALSKEKSQPLQDYIREARIVPVSISYEYDPCDQSKAREIYEKEAHGSYQKEEHEDVKSIAKGITGYKGDVHVSFGDVLKADYANVEEVTEEIDRQVKQNYVLHPTNCFAYEMLENIAPEVTVGADKIEFTSRDWTREKSKFKEIISTCNQKWLETMLTAYANPVYGKLGAL